MVLILLGIIVLTGTILSLPPVQTQLAKKATTYLNETFNTNINVERVKVSIFFGDVALEKVYIEDYKQDSFFGLPSLRDDCCSVRPERF